VWRAEARRLTPCDARWLMRPPAVVASAAPRTPVRWRPSALPPARARSRSRSVASKAMRRLPPRDCTPTTSFSSSMWRLAQGSSASAPTRGRRPRATSWPLPRVRSTTSAASSRTAAATPLPSGPRLLPVRHGAHSRSPVVAERLGPALFLRERGGLVSGSRSSGSVCVSPPVRAPRVWPARRSRPGTALRLAARQDVPPLLRSFSERLASRKHGNPVGPTYETLLRQGRTPEEIISGAGRTNPYINRLMRVR